MHDPVRQRTALVWAGIGGGKNLGLGRSEQRHTADRRFHHTRAAQGDVDQNHLQEASQALDGQAKLFSDFRDLIGSGGVDAVLVATPDHWHGLAAIEAARAGKHVYCEKPLTNSIGEGRALCQAVQDAGVVLQTGSHERSNPGARIAKQLIQEGRLGKVHKVHIQLPIKNEHLLKVKAFRGTPPTMPVPDGFDYDFWLGHAPEKPYTEKRCHFWWRFISDYGGGEMTDRGCHVIDLAQMILGLDHTGPVLIEATGAAPNEGLYDAFLDFSFRNVYANGLVMTGDNSEPRGLWIEGTEGKLFVRVHGADLAAEPASILDGVEIPPAVHYDPHRIEFLNAIRSRGDVIAPVEAGHRTASICHLNNLAMRLGKKIEWDPEAERSTDDEVNRLLTPSMRAPWSLEG